MENRPKHSLSIYGSHDASICIKPSHDFYRIYEFERLTKKRNYSLNKDPDFKQHLLTVKHLIEEEYGMDSWGSCFYAQVDAHILEVLKELFGFDHFEEMSHHMGHAACGLYQSPFEEECLIISSDSGGHELDDPIANQGIATFCIYKADKRKGIKKIANIPLDVCSPYTLLAFPISEINKTKENVWDKFLTYAGKIMGLAAYGEIRHEWLDEFQKFYMRSANEESLKQLGKNIGVDLSGINTISDRDSYDIAATSQLVFQGLVYGIIGPFIEKNQLPIIFTGGAALNVLMNQSAKDHFDYPIFVPCNPNDAGLSFGMLALRNPPEKQVNIQYNGLGILDIKELSEYVKKYDAKEVDVKEVARLISNGNIIGVMRGNSEVGARALGNRSILCNPQNSEMKDKINKIKKREFYRPFAPVVQEEHAEKYFNFYDKKPDSPYMSYSPYVKDKKIIPAVSHEDGTARVQTVTKEQNKFLYDLIDAVDTITGVGVLLNTSFNILGEPILTRISDALYVLENTELDYILIENYLFTKRSKNEKHD